MTTTDLDSLRKIAEEAPSWKDFNVTARCQAQREAVFAAVESMRRDVPALLTELRELRAVRDAAKATLLEAVALIDFGEDGDRDASKEFTCTVCGYSSAASPETIEHDEARSCCALHAALSALELTEKGSP